MNIQAMVNQKLAAQLSTLGAEDVTISGTTTPMILAESEKELSIMGGTREERRLQGSFPSDAGVTIKTGNKATIREQVWKVESVSIGQSMTHVTFIEPNSASV